jgi:hypothetical protein
MTSELETLRSLADRVRPPAFDALEEVARLRTRRTAATAAVGCVLSVLVIVGGIALVTAHDDRSTPEPVITPTTPAPTTPPSSTPTPDPSPTHKSDTSMTPEEVVLADDAELQLTGASLDDPDFRVSVWQATCHWCPTIRELGHKPIFRALAITSDGYATAVYRRPLFDTGLEHVESVGPGLLLIGDSTNGHQWLVRDDGTVTTLDSNFDEVPADDPRLWFVCLDNTGFGPAGAPTPDDAQPTWCALDPEANVVHVWKGPWVRTLDDSVSVVSPGAGELPWGVRDPTYGATRPVPAVDRAEVWWEVDGSRHREDLGPANASGPVLNGPPGRMSCWSWVKGSPTLTVFTSADQGSTWQSIELGVPFRIDPFLPISLSWTPGGDLVAREDSALYNPRSPRYGDGLRLWRASSVDGDSFELVHEARNGNQHSLEDRPFTVFGAQLWATRALSEDDGRTWTEPLSWR